MFTFWRVIISFLLVGTAFGLPPFYAPVLRIIPRKQRPHANTAGSQNEKFHNCNLYKYEVAHGANPGRDKGLKEDCCKAAGFTPPKGSKIRCV
ncbi:flavin-binding monooxygenase-like family protein [Colletotrichum higginsianum]|nr:flavin-binding monooxygenase-like family protein [Colletotrichum higginsianum]